ncbi:GCC2 and GCC3 family protein [Cryptosporidium felis]|nr:GCC2 and GCC3 family protein [Cryptosporidium felis]
MLIKWGLKKTRRDFVFLFFIITSNLSVLNATLTNECPIGYIHGENSCILCNSGTYTNKEANSCYPCGKGMYSFPGSYSNSLCFPCSVGTYSSNEISSSCESCPEFQITPFIGSTSIESCFCTPGYKARNLRDGACEKCASSEWCYQIYPNSGGFWNVASYCLSLDLTEFGENTTTYKICSEKALLGSSVASFKIPCFGREYQCVSLLQNTEAIANTNIDSLVVANCTEGNAGILCDECKIGYAKIDGASKEIYSCKKCTILNFIPNILFNLLALALIIYSVWVLRLEPTANEEEMPIVQVAIIRTTVQHIQILSLLFKLRVIQFEYLPNFSAAISYLGSQITILPIFQCIASQFGYSLNNSETLKYFSLFALLVPFLLVIFALIMAPLLRYFRQEEVKNYLLGRREMEGECLQFQKSYFSWFFSIFLVSYFVYFTSIIQGLYSVFDCVSVNVNIQDPIESLMTGYLQIDSLNSISNTGNKAPGPIYVVNIAKDNICWSSEHWESVYYAIAGLVFWAILIPLIFSICIIVDTKNDRVQRRRLVYGWWTSGYEQTGLNIWELFSHFAQILYFAMIFSIGLFHRFNYVIAYYAVPGGSSYETLIPMYTPILSGFCSIGLCVVFDSIYDFFRPNDQDLSLQNHFKADISSIAVDDELLTEDQKQQKRVAYGGGISSKQTNKLNWNSYYYFIHRMSSFSIMTAIFASILPRLNVNIENKVENLRSSWVKLTSIDPTPIGYNDLTSKFFSGFSVFLNYSFIIITIFSVFGIKLYKKIVSVLSSKTKFDINVQSMSDFSKSVDSNVNPNKLSRHDKYASSIRNNSRLYHDMSKTNQIGDQDGERVDDEISIEQLIRMHLRTDCLGFLTHEDRVSIVVSIKRCNNRQEGLAIALRATLDSRFGESGKYTVTENGTFICESLRSYGFSDLGLEKLIEDLLEIHITLTNRIKNVTRNSLIMAMDLCLLNYPEVAQKFGIEQIVPADLSLNDLTEKFNCETNDKAKALYSLRVRKLLARISMNALILDISDVYFRIPRLIPVSLRLRLNKGTGLLFSESNLGNSGMEKMEFNQNLARNEENVEIGYKVPIPGYIEEEYNEPRSLDVDLMLSIKKLTEGDPRTVLEETNYPLAFEKATKISDSSNKVLETLFSLLGREFGNSLGSSIEMNREGMVDSDEEDERNQEEEIAQLLLGINPDENIGNDVMIDLLNDLEMAGNLENSIDGFYSDKLSDFGYPTNEGKSNSASRIAPHLFGKNEKGNKGGKKGDRNNEELINNGTKNKMSLKLKNSMYNLYLLRVLDLKLWLAQYRKQYIEETNKKLENIRACNYLNYDNTLMIPQNKNKKGPTNSSIATINDNNKNEENGKKQDGTNNGDSETKETSIQMNSEVSENLKTMTDLVSNLNRYASPSMLFYYLQLCKRLRLGADFTMTSLIPDCQLDKGIMSNEEAIRLYREINPSLNFYENPHGFDVATIHEFSALNTPNLNLKRELEFTIESQREFNMIFPSALPCIHSIFWVPFDIYDDDNLWIAQSKERENVTQFLDLISKDHPQLVELPYIDEEIIDEKLENVEFDKNDQGLIRQTLNVLLPQITSNGGIEDGTWLWSELPLRFAIDLNGLTIRKLYSSSNYQKSIYLSGNPLSVIGPQSPQWSFMSHKSERVNYLNGICTLNYSINNVNCAQEKEVGDQALIVVPGIETKETSFTIEVWVKLPPLIEQTIEREDKNDEESESEIESKKSNSKSKVKSKSKTKMEGKTSSRSKSKKKKIDALSTNKDKSQTSSLSKIQKKLAVFKGNADNEDEMNENNVEEVKSDVDNFNSNISGETNTNSNIRKKVDLPTLHVLCSTDAMEGLFTLHRPTGTIGFWDSNGRFLKCIIKNDPKDINKNEMQFKNSAYSTSNVATLQSIYSQLGLMKKSTHCRETNQDIEQFIDYCEDPWILDPWVLVHIVYNMGSIKYYVNGRFIGSVRRPNGLKGDISIIGGGLESGSGWGYFSQFRVYGTHTSNEQIKKRYESYVSLNSDNSFVTKINKLTSSTINWALTLWRSGAVGFFIWKYSQINLKSNDITYLIELVNRKNNVLNNGDIVDDDINTDNNENNDENDHKFKYGILLFGIVIRILKGERSFPYYYIYEPLPYLENNDFGDENYVSVSNGNATSSSDCMNNKLKSDTRLSRIRYKMTSVTSQLGYRVSEDYKKIKLDSESVYRMNPLYYQPGIVPGPGMSECLLLAFNTKSNNSGLLITPPIELQRRVRSRNKNINYNINMENSRNQVENNPENVNSYDNGYKVSELYSGWTITVWFHYPLLTNYSFMVNNNPCNIVEDENINARKKSTSDIDHYIVLVTGKNDSHIVINENMDVGVYKNFSKISNNYNINCNNLNNGMNTNNNSNNMNKNSNNYGSSNQWSDNYNHYKNNLEKGFYSSGLNLNKAELPIGWHLLSVVGKPRMVYTNTENGKERNVVGGGGLGYTEMSTPTQKNANLVSQYKWCQEFYIDGQIMGISSYCTHESILMIGNSLFLENAFGIFTCPRIFSRSFSPIEVQTDFLSYNYLIKAGSWNPKDDILLQFDYNEIVKEFQVLENPSNKLRYICNINPTVNNLTNTRENLKSTLRDRRLKKKKGLGNGNIEIDDKVYWLDEMECQSPLFNYIETFLYNSSDEIDRKYVLAINNALINQLYEKNKDNGSIVGENRSDSSFSKNIDINNGINAVNGRLNNNKNEICEVNVKNSGIITIHRGPTDENICIDPTQIFILEKKSGYASEGGSVIFERPVRLSKNWSCEFWFCVPFEITYHPYCLLSNNDGIGFIVIGLNGELGSIQKKVTNFGENNEIVGRNNSYNKAYLKSKNKNEKNMKRNHLQFLSWDINLRDYAKVGWYHMVVVFNTTQNNTIVTYINSQCVGKKMNVMELPHHQSPWIDCIGNLKSVKGNYIAPFGLFGHLKIYDFALSSIEVGLLYKNWMCHKNLKREILNRHIKQEKSAMTKIYTIFNDLVKKNGNKDPNEQEVKENGNRVQEENDSESL